MAWDSPYADVARFRAQTGLIGQINDAVAESLLKAVSRWMERKLGVESFNLSDAASARVFVASADHLNSATATLRVPPIGSLTNFAVKIDTDGDGDFADEVALASTGYELLPRDAATRPEPEPWTKIALYRWGEYTVWPVDTRVQVTAFWGWPAVPEAIQYACVEFAQMVRGEGAFATGRISEMDQVIDASPQARSILKGLMMVYSPTAGIGIA